MARDRSGDWYLQERPNDLVDVHQGRKTILTGVTEAAARRAVRKAWTGGDQRVFAIEADGYQTDITRSFTKR